MQLIIEHSKTKRRIDGYFNLCASAEDFKKLRDEIDAFLGEGSTYGWISITDRQESLKNTEPSTWD